MRFSLIPRNHRFYDLFEESAHKLVVAAEALVDLNLGTASGLVHAVNTGSTTWHGFATEIARLLEVDADVQAVSTEEFPRPAPRPGYSVLDTSRLASLLGRSMPPWQDALARYLEASCGS